jgi:hypothetical protein
MQRYTISKFYRPENIVELAVSRIKECGGTLDKVRYPKLGDEDGAIWVTFTKDGMPDAFRISKGPMGPYRLFELPALTFFPNEDVAKFMVDTLRAMPDKGTLKTANKAAFEAICHWLHRESDDVLNEIGEA